MVVNKKLSLIINFIILFVIFDPNIKKSIIMRMLKGIFVVLVIAAIVAVSSGSMAVIYSLAIINFIIFSFNLLVRRLIAFKPYFLSRFNIFSANFNKEFEVDISADLAFAKILEVIADSGFKLVTADKDKLEILAISKLGWKSWGENIYFTFKGIGESTLISFDSAALFQMYTWGKNEDNYTVFFRKLDESFTI